MFYRYSLFMKLKDQSRFNSQQSVIHKALDEKYPTNTLNYEFLGCHDYVMLFAVTNTNPNCRIHKTEKRE